MSTEVNTMWFNQGVDAFARGRHKTKFPMGCDSYEAKEEFQRGWTSAELDMRKQADRSSKSFMRDIAFVLKHIGWVSVVINFAVIVYHFLSASLIQMLWGPETECTTAYNKLTCTPMEGLGYGGAAGFWGFVSILLAGAVVIFWALATSWERNKEQDDA